MFNIINFIKTMLSIDHGSQTESDKIGKEMDKLFDYDIIIDQETKEDSLRKIIPPKSLRIIKTARTKKEMKNAEAEGYMLLKQKVIPSKNIRAHYALIINKATKRIEIVTYGFDMIQDDIKILITFKQYPYKFASGIAAYLLPSDLKKGERVILDDLIEDIVGDRLEHSSYRLESAEAIWDGEKFIIDHDSYEVTVTF